MKIIDLDASGWKTPLEFFDALATGLEAPEWHGRSADAFLDTMIWHDDINGVAPPYTVRIHGLNKAPGGVRAEVEALRGYIHKHRSQHRSMHDGRDVEVSLETASSAEESGQCKP